MAIKKQINDDLKAAMLGGDKQLATILRGIKSALLYAEVDAGKRKEGLSSAEEITVLQKELKKRKESADLYEKGGDKTRADIERKEAEVINKYLPAELSDKELKLKVDEIVQEFGEVNQQNMGQIIGKVKAATAGSASGARIAEQVKRRMQKQ